MFYAHFNFSTGEYNDYTSKPTVEQLRVSAWECSHDWLTFSEAEKVANDLTKNIPGENFLAIDRGPNVAPEFDVIVAPEVGDFVSRTFNGDYYPDSEIVSISKTYKKITTSSGSVYYRRRLTGTWVEKGGTFVMIKGYHDRRNWSF